MDISLVITSYNKGKFIDRAIRSCINQFLLQKKVQVIVVDDCSTDNSLDIIDEFKDEVEIIKFNVNRGVSAASNAGLKASTGRYWMRVDADDYLSMESCFHLSSILDANQELDYVYCDHYRVDALGKRISKVSLDNKKIVYAHGAGILFRRDKLLSIGGYDETLRNAEDFDLLVRLDRSGSNSFYLPIPLYRYYIHGENMTLTPDRIKSWNFIERKYGI